MTYTKAAPRPGECARLARDWRVAARHPDATPTQVRARLELAAWFQTNADCGDVPDTLREDAI